MRTIRTFILGGIIGVLLGLWFGVNIGRNQPFWSNPFAEADVGGAIRQKSGRVLEKGGQALERGGDSLQGKERAQ